MTSTQQRIADIETEIEKLKDGIYHATLSPQLFVAASRPMAREIGLPGR